MDTNYLAAVAAIWLIALIIIASTVREKKDKE